MPDFPPPNVGRWPAPSRPGGLPKLVLARRRPSVTIGQPDAAEEPVHHHSPPMVHSRHAGHPSGPSNGSGPTPSAVEPEKAIRALEARLTERERAIDEMAARLAEREREIAETEALLTAREKVLEAALQQEPKRGALSHEEQAALEALKAELHRQEVALREAKTELKEREAFLEESENRLFEKVQAQQEKESELEQREEDVRARERRLREREAEHDPAAAAALADEKARAAAYDEFNE